jgi:hypothetical protein
VISAATTWQVLLEMLCGVVGGTDNEASGPSPSANILRCPLLRCWGFTCVLGANSPSISPLWFPAVAATGCVATRCPCCLIHPGDTALPTGNRARLPPLPSESLAAVNTVPAEGAHRHALEREVSTVRGVPIAVNGSDQRWAPETPH